MSDTTVDLLRRMLSHEKVARYLNASGWAKRESRQLGYSVYSSQVGMLGHGVDILLPPATAGERLVRGLLEAVEILSSVEEREALDVARSIYCIDRDVVNAGLPVWGGEESSIPVSLAKEYLQGLTDVVAFTAESEVRRTRYSSRQFCKRTKRFIGGCRFGHTRHGSFCLSLEFPLEPKSNVDGELLAAADPPFSRRVSMRLFRGLALVKTAVEDENPDVLVRGAATGFNGNVCEKLAALLEPPEIGTLSLSAQWSSEWPVPDGPIFRRPISLGAPAQKILALAAATLRGDDESDTVTVKSRVLSLKCKAAPDEAKDDGPDRVVTVLHPSRADRNRLVHVPLSLAEYQCACDAHKNGEIITVTGELIRSKAKSWFLGAPRGFQVIREGAQLELFNVGNRDVDE